MLRSQSTPSIDCETFQKRFSNRSRRHPVRHMRDCEALHLLCSIRLPQESCQTYGASLPRPILVLRAANDAPRFAAREQRQRQARTLSLGSRRQLGGGRCWSLAQATRLRRSGTTRAARRRWSPGRRRSRDVHYEDEMDRLKKTIHSLFDVENVGRTSAARQ